jgi:hypothetical protein
VKRPISEHLEGCVQRCSTDTDNNKLERAAKRRYVYHWP